MIAQYPWLYERIGLWRWRVVRDLNASEGMTVFLVEQNAHHALRLADRGYVMVTGEIAMAGSGEELMNNAEIKAAYLEGGRGSTVEGAAS